MAPKNGFAKIFEILAALEALLSSRAAWKGLDRMPTRRLTLNKSFFVSRLEEFGVREMVEIFTMLFSGCWG